MKSTKQLTSVQLWSNGQSDKSASALQGQSTYTWTNLDDQPDKTLDLNTKTSARVSRISSSFHCSTTAEDQADSGDEALASEW